MSLYPAAEPLAAAAHSHDLTGPDVSQLDMHECAEQGIRLASSHLELPQDSQIKTPSNDLGAGSLLPQHSPQDAVDQNQAAACVTSDAQDIIAVQLSAWPAMNGGDSLNQGKAFHKFISRCMLVALIAREPQTLILCHSDTTICSRGNRTTS
jgi:hypothetical protein